jgi:ketosteroid isomerase-like protein
MDAKEIGAKLVEHCKKGDFMTAISELYSPNIVSVEAMGNEEMPAEMRGVDAIRGKNEWWTANHDVHSMEAHGPYPNGDKFAVRFVFDVTSKAGPMAGKRFQMDEVAVYTVQDGKIVREEFFYGT